jgi:hypothetical protein
MQISLASPSHVPTPVATATEQAPAVTHRQNKLSKAFTKIKKAFKHPKPSKPSAPVLPVNTQPAPREAAPAPTITLPSPIPLLPLDESIQGIDRQLASLHMARADNIIEKYDRKLAAVYGTSIDETPENVDFISNVQILTKERNAYAFSRNLYAQGKVQRRTHALHGPANERAQKHISGLDNAASTLNDAMAAILQKSAGRQATPELENDYIRAHEALSEHRNAWLTGKLDESSKTSLRVVTLTDRLRSCGIPVPNSSAMQSSQLRKQLEQNVMSERLKFDDQPALFAPDEDAAPDTWSSTPFYELDCTSPPVATGAGFKISHSPITTELDKKQTERIQRHVAELEKEIEQIDARMEGLANGRPDPLNPEQLRFIRNAISQLRNSWAAGKLTHSSSVGKLLKRDSHDLRRSELEQAVILAKAHKSTATQPEAINPALTGSALVMTQGNVKRCDEALAEFDRAIYKAQHTGIEGINVSQNVFEAREAMMQLRNAWASGELVDTPPGAKPTRHSADERRRAREHQVQQKALILLRVDLPEPPKSTTSTAILERIKFASKNKIIQDINHDLAGAYLKVADPAFADQVTHQATLAPVG